MGKFLTTRTEVVNHLSDAINQRKRWVFITDHPQGHQEFVALALAIEFLEANADLACGFLDWLNWPTNHRATISFLTVPKDKMSLEKLERAVREWDVSQAVTEEQDLIIRAENVEAVTTFLIAMRNKNIVGEG